MDILSVSNFTFLLYFGIFLIHQRHLVVSEYLYTPTDRIFLSCGSSGDTTDDDRQWIGDVNSKYSPLEPHSVNKSIAATALDQPTASTSIFPYKNARISQSQFTYNFKLTAGPKFVRLYFFPTTYRGSNNNFTATKGFLDVTAGPYTLLRNFSALLYAGDWETDTFTNEYTILVQGNQQLNITFSPFLGDTNDTYAYINAIEIVSMPTYLYYTMPNSSGVAVVGENEQFYIQNDTALEMHCRVNIGGNSLSPTEDTGMYRAWDSDVIYVYPVDTPFYGQTILQRNGSLHYSKVQPYTTPETVYRVARSIGQNKLDNLKHNLTWQLIVERGFKYLVRLHFCEIDSRVTKPGERLIIISMNNEKVDTGFDILQTSGGQMTPIYKDYIVTGAEKAKTDTYELLISLKPNESSVYDDVILNGLEVFKLSNSRYVLDAGENPASASPPSPSPASLSQLPNKSNNKKALLIAIGTSAPGLLIAISLYYCWIVSRRRRRKGKHWDSRRESLFCWCCSLYNAKSSRSEALPKELCRYFSLSEIRDATNNFDDEMVIGKGGFGKVFKGVIDGGEKIVAIKRLSPESGQGHHQFETEIKMLSHLRHVHLVSLIGYCYQGREMILVYEYMTNGTLQEHLYGAGNDPLSWRQRLEICIGTARGLNYLHTGAEQIVIHRDVKTTNILLDENWIAKVSDFGLSRLGLDSNPINTKVVGTFGYLDLEYATRSQLTEKSDVYSFGVVLLEVLSGRKPVNNNLEEEKRSLALWAKKCIENGTIHEIVDPALRGKIAPECFDKFVEIAEKCVRDKGIDRPNMQEVIEMLEFALLRQDNADAEKKATNPSCEVVYPELLYHPPQYPTPLVSDGSEFDSRTASRMGNFHGNSETTESSSWITSSTNYSFSDTTNSTLT
ncbi:hypothetical protein K2173_025985 [Erythroxylum novogranatense]|uniref:Protein kinase domain-containing protein n=1 Tax=Erythroxylum novogranatense TaxID=1862640 RepID=A0AAV8SHW2_9ROSI|nr:hypothetical protein K2173_025985 [Erythroxylum novogranatense]